MTRQEFLRQFIIVRKCARCGEILLPHLAGTAFCDSCRIEWNAALTYSCNVCLKSAIECDCMPKALSSAGALCLRRLFFYDKDKSYSAPMSTIFWLKYKKSNRMASFIGEYVAQSVSAELESFGYPENLDSFLVTHVPRSRRAKALYGFDQSKMLARNVAKRIGVECLSVFGSASKKQQKRLSTKARMANAKKSIAVRDKVDVRGKYVVLIDDVVTTGASMASCVSLLRKQGARGILCFALTSKNNK